MKKVNNITKLYTGFTIILGTIALILLIVGVATRKWISITTSLSPLETQISQALTNTTFITSLIIATNANQAQVVQIVSATAQKVEQLLSGVGSSDTTYHLYGKNPNVPATSPKFKSPQGFIFAGISSIFVGLLLALIVIVFGLPRIIRFLPLFFLTIGPIFITVGFSIYPKLVIEDFGKPLELSIDVGFSIYLVISAAIVGFNTASTFAFIILQPFLNPPPNTRILNPAPKSMFRPSYPPTRMGRRW
jgi:hypothetical protein